MKDQNKYDGEQISSLVDDELDGVDPHVAIESMLADQKARLCWERYNLVSDTLKRDLPDIIDCQFASRVMAELHKEPTVLAPHSHPTSTTKSTFTKRLAGLAVAASVATVAIFGAQMLYRKEGIVPTQQYAQLPGAKNTEIASMAGSGMAGSGMGGAEISQGDIQNFAQTLNKPTLAAETDIQNNPYINKYLLDHNRHAARGVVQGVMPYVRIIIDPEMQEIIRQEHSQLQAQRK
jgi:negative regulator of sigma E activity